MHHEQLDLVLRLEHVTWIGCSTYRRSIDNSICQTRGDNDSGQSSQGFVAPHPLSFFSFGRILRLQDGSDATNHGDSTHPVEAGCRGGIGLCCDTHIDFYLFGDIFMRYFVQKKNVDWSVDLVHIYWYWHECSATLGEGMLCLLRERNLGKTRKDPFFLRKSRIWSNEPIKIILVSWYEAFGGFSRMNQTFISNQGKKKHLQ